MHSVTVMMSTYNGEKYLEEQIQSLINQRNVHLSIWVRDDGSSDNTVGILQKYKKLGVLNYYEGENLGPAYSFLDLINSSPQSDFYAFCDQDDIWENDKLYNAVKALEQYKSNRVALYYCGARVVNSEMNTIGQISAVNNPDYVDCLIHNSVLGCTMVFSQALYVLLKRYCGSHLLMHDDLTIKLCVLAGGTLINDKRLLINYRIHGNNVVGTQEPFFHALRRRIKTFLNRSCDRSKELQDIYEYYKDIIPMDKLDCLRKIAYYKKSVLGRFKVVFDKKIRASNKKTTRHFKIAVLFGFY